MICPKCNRFNMSDEVMCKYCGAELVSSPASENLKHFAGEDFKFSFDASDFEKSAAVQEKAEEIEEITEAEAAPLEFEYPKTKTSIVSYDDDISFESDFSFSETSFESECDSDSAITQTKRTALRNTALLAVILAILIDAILTVSMVIYFKGFSQKIVNVSNQNVIAEYIDISERW